jgi:hypothetical protein
MGDGPYYTVEIAKQVTLRDLLTHLYVLMPKNSSSSSLGEGS